MNQKTLIGLYFIFVLLFTSTSYAATWYVDKNASGSNNGTSWANAWTDLSSISGVGAGDTVYISGGTISTTYSMSNVWTPTGGTSGNPITYKVGQDSGHNGTVIFDGMGTVGYWLNPSNWVTIDGEYNGTRHIKLQNYKNTAEFVVARNKQGIVLKYITFQTGDAISLNGSSYYEVAYSYMHSTYNHAIGIGAPPAAIGWDINRIHNNTIILDQKLDASGFGSDGIQWGNSLSLYNNEIIGNPTSAYTYGQHQDGIQADGKYIKIYNNVFKNMANFGVFLECFGDVSDMRVYNNVIYMSNNKFAGGYQRGIAIIRSGGASGVVHFTNIIVANNTIANYSGSAINMASGAEAVWDSSSMFYNNIGYNSGNFTVDPNISGRTSPSNKNLSSGASDIFIAYQAPTASDYDYNFHLKSTDTVLKDQGVVVVPSTDKDGVSRPQGTGWDIGAYEYTTIPNSPISLRIAQ